MQTSTELATTIEHEGALLVLRKRSEDAPGRQRLRREHQALVAGGHPGVAAVVGFEDGPTDTTLTLAYVGNRSLATLVHPSVDDIARIIAALATTVGDLHRLGVVLGAITADDVVLDEGGRPVIVSLAGGHAEPPRGDGPHPEDAHHGHDRDDGDDASRVPIGDPADDVAGLGELLHGLLDRHREGGALASDAASMYAWRRRRSETIAARSLRELANRATAEEPRRRPSAHHLAADAAATTTTNGAPRPGPQHGSVPSLAGRGLGAAIGLTGAALVVLLVIVSRTGPRPTLELASPPPQVTTVDTRTSGTAPPVLPAPPTPLSAPTTEAGTATVPTPVASPENHARPAVIDHPSDLSPAPPDQTTVERSGVIRHDGRRFAIGDPGDEIVVGDFACAGAPRAAVLRPGSGELFLFDGWADGAGDQLATVATVLPLDAHLLPPTLNATGCASLRALLADGTEVTVALDHLPPDPPGGTRP
jgi:hypothetical protein